MRKPAMLLVLAAGLCAAQPETVLVTLHAKAGGETELARTIAKHWDTAQRLNLVQDSPHVSLRGLEPDGKAFFVEVFAWRDAHIPDNAPAEIRAVWDELNNLVEPRGGHPGLDLVAVTSANNEAPEMPDLATEWAADWSAKRLEHILTLYTPDAVFHTTEAGSFTGTVAIRELFQKALAANDPTIRMKRVKAEHSGDLGFESGEYEETLASKGKTRHVSGHYLMVLRRISGRWLIAEQTWTESPEPK